MSVRLLAFLVLFASAATACSPTQLLAGGFQRSDNFDVFTPTVTTTEDAQNYARAVLQRAEHYRRAVATEWLGAPLPPSVGRATINVSHSDRDYGLTWAKDDANRKYHTVYLSTSVDRALNHTLAHEIVHVVLATRFPHPNRLPAWFEEGIASRYDDPDRQRTREQIVAWWAETGNWPNLQTIVSSENISTDDQSAYAASASVIEFLLSRRDAKTLMAFGEAARSDLNAALRANYDLADTTQLQQAWQTWASAPRQRVSRAEAIRSANGVK
ncbi:MAG: hypothetical protein R3C99_20155 [Pirellulaceae bacterium]|nr:hypothetical protein [Planctomycetales bacterium]MCA9204389.1 hypothetical protein [Planctomycetales bacterium]MCA9207675.1 hypothetical protein [Planctomycetales bacterium]MCA9222573.1 hypothetical protein [Planctomycetales bacterium]